MTFDETFDVVVLGRGCAGMMSALVAADQGVEVVLFEKADVLGGTAALSSGVAWLPGNKFQADHGVPDSAQAGRDYLTALSNGMILPEFTDAFVSTVNEMLEWTEQRAPLQMQLVPGYPDYHPEFPGGLPPAAVAPPSPHCSPSTSWGSGPTGSSVSAARCTWVRPLWVAARAS